MLACRAANHTRSSGIHSGGRSAPRGDGHYPPTRARRSVNIASQSTSPSASSSSSDGGTGLRSSFLAMMLSIRRCVSHGLQDRDVSGHVETRRWRKQDSTHRLLPSNRAAPADAQLHRVTDSSARRILDRRYASGEITRDQYLQMKQDLGDSKSSKKGCC